VARAPSPGEARLKPTHSKALRADPGTVQPCHFGHVSLFEVLYPKDPSVKIERTEDSVTFSWKKKPSDFWAAIVFASMLTAMSFMPVTSRGPYGSEERPGPSLGLIGFLALFSVPLLYYGLSALLNSTRISADRSRVTRWAGPLWTGRSVAFDVQGIQQFFSTGAVLSRNSGTYSLGTIYLIDGEGHVHPLASGLPSSFAANQIAHELEDYYGIEDMPVYGVTTDPAHPGPRGIHL